MKNETITALNAALEKSAPVSALKTGDNVSQLAAIFEVALERVAHRNYYSCCAIRDAARKLFPDDDAWEGPRGAKLVKRYTKRYTKLFSPRKSDRPGDFWLDHRFHLSDDALAWRLTALAFALAMVNAGDFTLEKEFKHA